MVWINSWFDPGREREAADTLISQGADVLTHHTDSTAVVQAAEAKKVYAIAYNSDMTKYGPNAAADRGDPAVGRVLHEGSAGAIAGTWKPGNIWGGIKEGMIRMGPFNKVVPKDVQDMVAKTSADIAAGKFHPFTGPMSRQRRARSASPRAR